MPIPAKNIHEVISELDLIVQKSILDNNKLGLFAALYKKVTQNVGEGIKNNRFQDGARMERLDVIFANRYLEAYKAYFEGKKITNSWQVTFEAAKNNNVLILQHLLTGMNTHISLDLGIASAQAAQGRPLAELEHDFNEINNLLGDLIDGVQTALSKASPIIFTLDWVAGKMDEDLARFNLGLFRKRAWGVAVLLYALDDTARHIAIEGMDKQIKSENTFFTSMAGTLLSPAIRLLAKWQSQQTTTVIKALNSL
jgi:hypothetical protein